MSGRYFEIIMTGRQLTGLIAGVASLILVAFALGVGVGLRHPTAQPMLDLPQPEASPPPAAAPFEPTAAAGPAAVEVGTAAPVAPVVLPASSPAALADTPPAPVPPGPSATAEPLSPTVPALLPSPSPPSTATAVPTAGGAVLEPTPPAMPAPTGSPAAAAGGLWVQIGALSRPDLAADARRRVIALGFAPSQIAVHRVTGKYRVRLGPFPDGESARRVARRLQAEGFRGAFVVKE